MSKATTTVVNVLRRATKADPGEKMALPVTGNETLADIRVILTGDEFMLETDKFVRDSSVIGKSSEATFKLTDIIKSNSFTIQAKEYATSAVEKVAIPTNNTKAPEGMKSVNVEAQAGGQINVQESSSAAIASRSAKIDMKALRGFYELEEHERELVYKLAGLGQGVDISSNNGPRRTGLHAVDIIPSDISVIDCERNADDIVISYSARAAAYASNGWCEAAISVESPWASGSVSGSYQTESSSTSSNSTVYITGRYLYSHCQITLKPFTAKPSAEFEKCVRDALAQKTATQRTNALKEVFSAYGHVYVTSVEMGGMKHVTTQKAISQTTTAESVKWEMKASIAAKYSFYGGSVQGGGGQGHGSSQNATNSFESMQFDTVGGNVLTNDIAEWKESLVEPDHWKVIRVLTVKPVIELFDEKTQAEIFACAPQLQVAKPTPVPMYRLWSHNLQAHFYTMDVKERDRLVKEGGYSVSGGSDWFIGYAFAVQAPNTVPLYRLVYDNRRHFFTIHEQIYKNLQNNKSWKGEGIKAWVYPTYRADAKPLFCLFMPMPPNGEWDRIYTTDSAERDRYLKAGWKYDDDNGRMPAYFAA